MVPGVIVWLLCGFQHQSLEVVWLPTSLPQRADTFIENGLVSWVGYCKLWVGVLSFYLVSPLSLFTFMHWRRKWQPTPVFLPGESRDGEPGGLPSMGLHRVGHDWSDLAAAAALVHLYTISHYSILLWKFQFFRVRNRGFSSGYVADPQSKWWAQWLDSGHLTWKPELDTVSRAHRWGWWYFMVRTSRRNWDQLLYLVLHSPFYWGFYSNPLS